MVTRTPLQPIWSRAQMMIRAGVLTSGTRGSSVPPGGVIRATTVGATKSWMSWRPQAKRCMRGWFSERRTTADSLDVTPSCKLRLRRRIRTPPGSAVRITSMSVHRRVPDRGRTAWTGAPRERGAPPRWGGGVRGSGPRGERLAPQGGCRAQRVPRSGGALRRSPRLTPSGARCKGSGFPLRA